MFAFSGFFDLTMISKCGDLELGLVTAKHFLPCDGGLGLYLFPDSIFALLDDGLELDSGGREGGK